jgi:hypothetical protein
VDTGGLSIEEYIIFGSVGRYGRVYYFEDVEEFGCQFLADESVEVLSSQMTT